MLKGNKFNIKEFIGGLGDLGVLIPLSISLILINGLNPTSVYFIVGLLYIISGIYLKIPFPVQPMKTIAAIAIVTNAKPEVLCASGIIIGIILVFLSVTKIIDFLYKIVSFPVIRGIQFGLGIMLIINGLKLIFKDYSLPSVVSLSLGPVIPSLSFPDKQSFILAFFTLVVPQMPVTLGNSIMATVDASKKYFGEKSLKVTPTFLTTSLGMVNIVSGFLGGMPMCHGANGLTAHYKFGARTGGATIMFGSILVFLSILFGKSMVNILSFIPFFVLGILLVYVGIQHALLIKDLIIYKQNLIFAVVIGLLCIFFNMMTGISVGLVSSLILNLPKIENNFS